MSKNNFFISLPDIEQINRQQRLGWLVIFSRIALIIGIISLIFSTVNILSNKPVNIFTCTTLSIMVFVFFICYQLGKRNYLQVGSWLLISSFLLTTMALYPFVSTSVPLYIGFLIPIAIAAVLLGFRPVIIITVISLGYATIFIVLADLLHLIVIPQAASPQVQSIAHIFYIVVLLPGLIAMIGLPFQVQSRALQQQNQQLRELLTVSQQRQITIEAVSYNVQNISTVLKSGAWQQDNNSRDQVSAVAQVNSSLKELHATATHIASVSQQVNEAAETMNNASQKIEQISQTSVNYNRQGITALQRTNETTNRIAQLYESLRGILEELAAKTTNMRQILLLLKNITNQTHLLALNASIEAAGAGVYGKRFGVIAQQVKELANHSNLAREQVESDVTNIEQTTAQAVEAVLIGHKDSIRLGQVNQETQQVFSQIFEIAATVEHQSDAICSVAQEVKHLTETVQLSTTQQRSATEQILSVLFNLSTIAQQNATGSQQVSSTVQQLEEMSEQLIYSLENVQ